MQNIIINAEGYTGRDLKAVYEIVKKSLFTQRGINYSKIEMLSTKFFPDKVTVQIITGETTGTIIKLSISQYEKIYGDIEEHFMRNNSIESLGMFIPFVHKNKVRLNYRSQK